MRIARSAHLVLLATLVTFADAARVIDSSGIDRSVSPSADFYRFANGKWLDSVEIGPDRPVVGTFSAITERNQQILHEVVEEASAGAPAKARSEKDKVGLFYRVGMDQDRAERLAFDPIKPELDRIDAITSKGELVDEMAGLHRIGVRIGFAAAVVQDRKDRTLEEFELRQGALGIPSQQFYVGKDQRAADVRNRYQQDLKRLLSLIGESDEQAFSHSTDTLAIEVRFAEAMTSPAEAHNPQGSYHPMTLEKLGSSFPNFGWDRFFKDLGKPDPGQINVAQPAYCKMFDDEFEGENLDSWKGYLKCQLLLTAAPLLSKPFSDAVFDITSAVTGATQQPPRWRKVIAIENAVLANAMGRLYVNRVFSPEAKQSATKLVENLKAVLRERIQQLDWMGPDTKKEALAKLDAMTMKVGYPEVWRDYGKLEIKDDSFVQNVFRANEFEFLRNIERLDRPVDERAFEIPPQAADAFYVPTLNAVVLPAGILQPPFFDAKAPDAQNYGAIGCIIGHEMTHGFDNNGRQFDSKGELRDWWSIEDSRRFLDKASELIKQYDRYVAVDDIHVDGDLTLPENIADNGGMTIAYLAYKKATAGTTQPTVDDFTPDQQFFLAFAQVWRQKVRPEIARIQARNDVHAPPRFRVIGVLANHPEFWQAFGAEPPSKPITIW